MYAIYFLRLINCFSFQHQSSSTKLVLVHQCNRVFTHPHLHDLQSLLSNLIILSSRFLTGDLLLTALPFTSLQTPIYLPQTSQHKMAILDLVKGLEVLILANGKPLQEYDDDEKPTSTDRSAAVQYRASRTVTKYIESQDGEYEVHIRLDPSFNFNFPTLWATFKIDGNKSIDYVWQQYRHNGSSLWITRGAYVSKPGAAAADLVKPFTFSKIEISKSQPNF